MKIFIKILLLGIFSLAYAEVSVDTQIQAIKNAPPSERALMMNELKVRLLNMNSQDRSEAISQLRTQMRSQNKVQQQNHTQSVQADSQQQIHGLQMMNQKQVTTQMQNADTSSGMRFGKH